jgi:hypothetical protein
MTPPTTTLKDDAKRITALEIFNNLERAEPQSIGCYVLTSRHEFCDYEIHEAIVKDLQQQLAEKDKKINELEKGFWERGEVMQLQEKELAEKKEGYYTIEQIKQITSNCIPKAKVQEVINKAYQANAVVGVQSNNIVIARALHQIIEFFEKELLSGKGEQ